MVPSPHGLLATIGPIAEMPYPPQLKVANMKITLHVTSIRFVRALNAYEVTARNESGTVKCVKLMYLGSAVDYPIGSAWEMDTDKSFTLLTRLHKIR